MATGTITVSAVEQETEGLVRYLDATFASGVLNKLLPAINAAKNNMLNVFMIYKFKRKEISENIFLQENPAGVFIIRYYFAFISNAQIFMPDLKFVYIFSGLNKKINQR
jgi:hypothetical protein